jgi:hypothetical protein
VAFSDYLNFKRYTSLKYFATKNLKKRQMRPGSFIIPKSQGASRITCNLELLCFAKKKKRFAALCSKGLGPWCCRLASSHSNNCKELGSLEKKREEESERLASLPSVMSEGKKIWEA